MSRRRGYLLFLLLHCSSDPTYKTTLIGTTTLPYQSSKPILQTSTGKYLIAHYSSFQLRSCSLGNQQFKKPDEYDLADALKAASLESPNHGKQIHTIIIKNGFCRFTILMTALMDFNTKIDCLEEARRLFNEMPERDVVSWTSMIVGCARHQYYAESLGLFQRMIAADTIPNAHSFSGALTACSGLRALRQGQQLHAHILMSGLLGASLVLQNNLLNMYSKCESLICARKLFDLMNTRGIIAWNEMISGYLQMGQGEEALKLFASMISEGVKPDNFSYAICADACADLASMQQGSQIHACILKSGFQSDLVIGNALVDMYAKCGCVDSAKLVFDRLPLKDTLLWTAMISAFGKQGLVKEVVKMFEQMRRSNFKPDGITYLAVLWACSHGGAVDEGWHYFRAMTEEDSIPAGSEHYACMVDLLCRSGNLPQTLEFIQQMPLKPSTSVWSAFLNSCRLHGNIELAQLAVDQLLELDPDNPSNLVVLSTLYAAERDWNESENIRERMKTAKVKKEPGCSWVELKNGIHIFFTADRSHPEMGDILSILTGLMSTCWEAAAWKN